MKELKYILTSLLVILFTACVEEDSPFVSPNGLPAISFGCNANGITRAAGGREGAAAAADLGGNYYIAGYKTLDGVRDVVIDHYNVNYHDGSSYSTESNTKGWEYVGEKPISYARPYSPADTTAYLAVGGGTYFFDHQTIKFWDEKATDHYFIAFSKGRGEVAVDGDGQTIVLYAGFTAVKHDAAGNPSYTVRGDGKQLAAAYYADIVQVNQSDYKTTVVTPRFCSIGAKVRVGLYETIPGYSVTDVHFYSSDNVLLANPSLYFEEPLFSQGSGIVTVSYPNFAAGTGDDRLKASLSFASDEVSVMVPYIYFNQLKYGTRENKERVEGDVYLGRTSATASYPGPGSPEDSYTDVLVPEGHTLMPLHFKADYTLVPTDGAGEKIYVHGASAVVPPAYINWQPNHTYTYLFRISDNTNGKTDITKGPVGLYPMTFDAVVRTDADGYQETVTIINGPSITTYQKGAAITENGDNIYSEGNVYVVVDDNGATPLIIGDQNTEGANAHLFRLIPLSTSSLAPENIPSENVAAQCFDEDNPWKDVYENIDARLERIDGQFTALDRIPASDSPTGKELMVNCGRIVVKDDVIYVIQYRNAAGEYTYKVLKVGGDITIPIIDPEPDDDEGIYSEAKRRSRKPPV